VWHKKGHRSGHGQGKQASWRGLVGSGLSGVSQRGIARHVTAQKRGAARGIGERSQEGLTGAVAVACGLWVTGEEAGRPWVQPVKNKRISKSG
jgi:hypothetical protein